MLLLFGMMTNILLLTKRSISQKKHFTPHSYQLNFDFNFCLQWPLPRKVTPFDELVECGDNSSQYNIHWKKGFFEKLCIIDRKYYIDDVFEGFCQCYSCLWVPQIWFSQSLKDFNHVTLVCNILLLTKFFITQKKHFASPS